MSEGGGAESGAGFTIERLLPDAAEAEIAAVEELGRAVLEGSGVSFREELGRAWSRIWVARGALPDPRAPVGFLLGWHVADELHVLDIAALPALRRRGIGRALMSTLLAYAREHKIRVVLLEVRRSNRPAIKLYRAFSFTALGVRKGYYADNGEDAIEMILALDPDTGRRLPSRDEISIDG